MLWWPAFLSGQITLFGSMMYSYRVRGISALILLGVLLTLIACSGPAAEPAIVDGDQPTVEPTAAPLEEEVLVEEEEEIEDAAVEEAPVSESESSGESEAEVEVEEPTAPPPTAEVDVSTPTAPPPTAEPEPTITATPMPVLDPMWFVDSDGNLIPDFIEEEAGFDPLIDDCAPAMCQMSEGGSALTQEQNVLIVLDASGSMAEPFGSETRMSASKEALRDYVLVTSDLANIGLLVYGHEGDNTEAGKPESCEIVELLGEFGSITPENIEGVLAQFEPNGWTPIGKALEAAETVLSEKVGAVNRIILVTDGLETCDGDPVAVAGRLHNQPNIDLVVDVIGLGVTNSEEVSQLASIAEAGGGTYYSAQNQEEFRQSLGDSVDEVFNRANFAFCIVENGVNYNVCTNTLYNRSTIRIRQEILKAPQSEAAAQLDDLIEAIELNRETADASFEAYRDDLEQLLADQRERDLQRQELFGDE